ncbi:hypothetical protein GGS23DRAFT_36523 [Durotheca rogersii]|uniref:uncharacterized protein n=1 Tax=Durotheca rogersii TaxID=419775 RepID=UPI00221F0516|nr:uncharacterized protein GGS23DRAFT_36523 [Durotheca rogersii]KAI5868550.1 hypothetical protein GGS23DRAFT_36523 [Durotheca rogersii]
MASDGIKDVHENMPGYIEANHWAIPYCSNHHIENPQLNLKMLQHVNCSYLSTPGRPPTLEALKQHAQSLTVLISSLAPNAFSAEIDNENNGGRVQQQFQRHEAFDWLNNLKIPYDNIDKAHRLPLNSLANLVRRNNDVEGVEFHCPLTLAPQRAEQNSHREASRPYSTHMNLLMHANDCLERLDHEYSAMGGILSIIPSDREDVGERPDLEDAKRTLVGQWILGTQHLFGRMHELEIAYANAIDLLATEAYVPAQSLSAHGPDGRSGREIIYPQDQWILANAGKDVFDFIHQRLNMKEAVLQQQDTAWANKGMVGDRLRNRQYGEDEDSLRGIVHVDLNTRFYRIKGTRHSPIFVLPAFSDRPGTEYTRDLEDRPTVVTVPAPSVPDRASAWDERNKKMDAEYTRTSLEVSRLTQENAKLKAELEKQTDTLKRTQHINELYEGNTDPNGRNAVGRAVEAERARDSAWQELEQATAEKERLRSELAAHKQTARAAQLPVPAEVTQANGNYTMDEATYLRYEGRSLAVDQAKAGAARAKSVIEDLARLGYLSLDDFAWIENIASSP